MKPKKQIDFLVEDFFNTGKLDFNKDEEGITFDQLDLLNESIMGKPAININNKIAMGDQAIGNSQFKEAKNYYITALDLFNELEEGMGIFLNPPHMNTEFIENKIVESDKGIWYNDYQNAKHLTQNEEWEAALEQYEEMLKYYENLNVGLQQQFSKDKRWIETSGFDFLKGKMRDRDFEIKQKEKYKIQQQTKAKNQEPLPLLSQDIEIEDDDMFLRTLQNILIQFQQQKFQEVTRGKEKKMAVLIDLEKERDESIYGPTTAKVVGDYQEANELGRTGEVDKKTWENLLSMEKRIARYTYRIGQFGDNKTNIVSPDEYEILITPKEDDGSALKTLLSHNLGNFLYHLQDKDIYAHTSFQEKDYDTQFDKLKNYYEPTIVDSDNTWYKNIATKYNKKISEVEIEIKEKENARLSAGPNSLTYKQLVDDHGINDDEPQNSWDDKEKKVKNLKRRWEDRWIEIDDLKKKISDFRKKEKEDIEKAKKFNEKYRKGSFHKQEKLKTQYIKDKVAASRQESTIVGLFKKLYKAVEGVELVGESPLKDINNAIAEINKTLKSEFSGEVSENRKTRVKQALKDVIDSIKDGNVDGETIEQILELKTLAWGEYEKGFIEGKGEYFNRGENRDIEGRIHNLTAGYLADQIKSDTESDRIKNNIKDNITTYLDDYQDAEGNTVERDIVKHDLKIKEGEGIRDLDGNVILPSNSKVEVKSQSYTLDSYYSEPLASPMKKTTSEIRKDPTLREKYNEIIDGLYDWINNTPEGEAYGERLIRKMISGTAGMLFNNDIYVPIDEIEFYISNKGQNSCNNHRRLTIRYRVKREVPITIYKLIEDNDVWKFESAEERITYSEDKKEKKLQPKYCGGETDKPNVKFDPHPLNESLDRYISEALGF